MSLQYLKWKKYKNKPFVFVPFGEMGGLLSFQ